MSTALHKEDTGGDFNLVSLHRRGPILEKSMSLSPMVLTMLHKDCSSELPRGPFAEEGRVPNVPLSPHTNQQVCSMNVQIRKDQVSSSR